MMATLPFAVPEYSIWLVCFLFYAHDNIKLTKSDEIFTVERYDTWFPRVPLYQMAIFGNIYTVIEIFAPWRMSVRTTWTLPESEVARVRLSRLQVREMIGTIGSLRLIGGGLYVVLFVAGPILTATRGLEQSLLLLGPIYGLCVVALIAESVRMVKNDLVPRQEWTNVVVQCLLCPGYFANVLRRYSLLSSANIRELDRLLARLKRRSRPSYDHLKGYIEFLREGGDLSAEQVAVLTTRYSIAPDVA